VRNFCAPLLPRQTGPGDFLTGARRAAACRSFIRVSVFYPRLNEKYQKVLAKSKAHH
jgi:hypothetical protein